ncbi:hypothetical protein G7Y89_g2007 [Cudoniella acicularis]|uniref:Bola-like protein n=1 Tax=Cudoniella acicularis TaxID=354080 RepID=A0A8H4RVW2_9HELO|nr:hypothetical protein G7Y89_g2007 [Cudoniella acicularis]
MSTRRERREMRGLRYLPSKEVYCFDYFHPINTDNHIFVCGKDTKESSIQGTIGKGESGVADEIAREREVLEAPAHLNEKERGIWELLMRELACERLEVQDISGGCGSMYGIDVISERFRGLSMLKQQRLVNEVLGEEIKGWHGVQLKTRAP